MARDVFISYEKSDFAVAEAVCRKLEEAGLRVWYAPRNILPGADWQDSIVRAIDGCRVVVLIYSAKSNSSDYVRREITYAATAKKTVIPFCLSPMSEHSGLGFMFSTSHRLDAFPKPQASHYQQLLNTTQNYISRSRFDDSTKDKKSPQNTHQPVALISPPEAADKTVAGLPVGRIAIVAIPIALVLAGWAFLHVESGNGNVAPGPTAPSPQSSLQTPSTDCGKIIYTENDALPGMDQIDGEPVVVCMDSLKIRNKVIKLAGIGSEKAHAVKQLSAWISLNGPTVHCQPIAFGASKYRCEVGSGSGRHDIAQYVLANHWASPQD